MNKIFYSQTKKCAILPFGKNRFVTQAISCFKQIIWILLVDCFRILSVHNFRFSNLFPSLGEIQWFWYDLGSDSIFLSFWAYGSKMDWNWNILILTSTISCESIKTSQKTFLFSIWEVVKWGFVDLFSATFPINSFIIKKYITLIGYFLVPKSYFNKEILWLTQRTWFDRI